MNTTTLHTLLRSALVVACSACSPHCRRAVHDRRRNHHLQPARVARTATSAANSFRRADVAFVTDPNNNCTNNPATAWAVGRCSRSIWRWPATSTSVFATAWPSRCPRDPGPAMPAGRPPAFANDNRWTVPRHLVYEPVAANSTVTYSWTGIEPGTTSTTSGSNPASRSQMGLYGRADRRPGPDPTRRGALRRLPGQPRHRRRRSVEYDIDAVIVFSEVDPALHTPPAAATPLGFKPKYFLVNGRANGSTSLAGLSLKPAGAAALRQRGLNTYVPNLLGEDPEVGGRGRQPLYLHRRSPTAARCRPARPSTRCGPR